MKVSQTILASTVNAVFNPFTRETLSSCLEECGGRGGKCEEFCGANGFCCSAAHGYADCTEMIRFGLSLLVDESNDDEFYCVNYNRNYQYHCPHEDYQLVKLRTGVMCLRYFEGNFSFDQARVACTMERAKIVAPGDESDAVLLAELANYRSIWLPWHDRETHGIWQDYKTFEQATYLNFAPREPDGAEFGHLIMNKYAEFEDVDDGYEASFFCGHDPNFSFDYAIANMHVNYTNNIEEHQIESIEVDEQFEAFTLQPIMDEPDYDYDYELSQSPDQLQLPRTAISDVDHSQFIMKRMRPSYIQQTATYRYVNEEDNYIDVEITTTPNYESFG